MMDIFTFSLTALISFMGLFFGGILSYWSKDEVHQLKSSIPTMQMILFVLILSFGFIYIFWHRADLNVLDYILFGVLFTTSSLYYNAHFYITAIITFFGILSGALFYAMHTKPSGVMKNKKELHIKHHKHSGKHLHIDDLLTSLFYKYYFYPIIAIASYIVAHIISVIIV